ncbi:hypothetical protein Y032_0005g2382 [Ancylostoma ceylanicum]|uniref:C-type lectin domain-containing protein n=1 Tax=Ancylostoma ceylanicum TaxID=53326 RepID=A0A016VRR3_9BILA|nr:hypothetical protein Y032_0005g2382 [Ancylostoma ceylanicum]
MYSKKSRTNSSEINFRKNRKGARNPTVRRAKTESDGWRSYLSSSYKVFQNARNFDDAEKKCREEGAHLVSIHSEQENQFVHSLTRTGHEIKNFEDFVYIGLRKNTRTGKWYWTDGSQVNYTKWAVHQPDEPETEHCTQLHQDPGPKLIYVEDRKWNSITCSRPMKYFVCKR